MSTMDSYCIVHWILLVSCIGTVAGGPKRDARIMAEQALADEPPTTTRAGPGKHHRSDVSPVDNELTGSGSGTEQCGACCGGGGGYMGPPGPPGLPGIAGNPGMPGVPGDHGSNGQNGVPGFPGAKGDAGDRGLSGLKGEAGDYGPPGINGHAGPRGPAGNENNNLNSWTGASPGGSPNPPVQSAFSVARLTTLTAPQNSDLVMTYEHTFTNINNNFDALTGVYAAPVPGAYMFMLNIHMASTTNSPYVKLMKNGQIQLAAHDYDYSDAYDSTSNSLILELKRGDQVWLQLDQGNEVHSNSNKYTTFSGYLLFQLYADLSEAAEATGRPGQ